MTYTLTTDPHTVVRDKDGAFIPDHPGNVDWQAYQTWLAVPNTPNPYAPPPLTRAQEAAAYLAGGLTITSDTPGLDGTYSVMPPDNHNINAIITSIANGTGLPLSQSDVAVFDTDGNQHMFVTQNVSDLAVMMRDFVHGSRLYAHGQVDTLPPNTVHLESEYLPSNTGPPVIAQSGGEINCTQGDWSGVPKEFHYEWRSNWVTTVGIDSPTYVVTNQDEGVTFDCIVTASNVIGEASAASNAIVAQKPKVPA